MDKFHILILVCHLLYILKRTADAKHSFKLMQLQELSACQASSLFLYKVPIICTILPTDMTFT